MKMLQYTCLVISLTFSLCLAGDYERQGQPSSGNARILRYDFDNIGTGAYRFGFASDDGIERDEAGNLVNEGTEDEALVVTGSFSYLGPDGVTYAVRYTADQNGFHPEGDHIKVPPFVPWVKGQHHEEHEHPGYPRESVPQKSVLPIYLPASPTPVYPSTPQPFAEGNFQKPVRTYIPSNRQTLDANTQSQVFSPLREPQQPLITYIPTRRDTKADKKTDTKGAAPVSSIQDVLEENENEKENKILKVNVEEINAL